MSRVRAKENYIWEATRSWKVPQRIKLSKGYNKTKSEDLNSGSEVSINQGGGVELCLFVPGLSAGRFSDRLSDGESRGRGRFRDCIQDH